MLRVTKKSIFGAMKSPLNCFSCLACVNKVQIVIVNLIIKLCNRQVQLARVGHTANVGSAPQPLYPRSQTAKQEEAQNRIQIEKRRKIVVM